MGFSYNFIIIQLDNPLKMCFLKTLKPLDTIPIEKGHVPVDILPQEKFLNPITNFSFSKKPQTAAMAFSLSKQDQLLLSLVQLMNSNTKLLQDVDKKLSYNDATLNNCFDQLNNVMDQSSAFKQDSQITQPYGETFSNDGEETSTDPLVEALFGKKKYLYKLELQGEIPTTIYKQRNINISVVLKNKQTEKVLNSNIIHLCLGVCDANGEWIAQNKAKENFMKGKTEVEMYHGETSFLKIYPREVSRTYVGGKLNFVVYAKPSLLKFTNGASTLQQIIDSDLIQPLVVKDISVKAKKKQ